MRRNNQSGNVFLFILLGVFLFGALIFTLTKSGNQGVASMSKQKIQITISDIENFGIDLENTINRLRSKGCSENQISLNYDSDGDGNYLDAGDSYNNASAPSDYRCHVFHSSGGKMQWPDFSDFIDPKLQTNPDHNVVTFYNLFAGDPVITGRWNYTGTAEADLVLMVPFLYRQVCETIAKQVMGLSSVVSSGHYLGVTTDIPYKNSFGGAFYSDHSVLVQSKPKGCIRLANSVNYPYTYYHTIISR